MTGIQHRVSRPGGAGRPRALVAGLLVLLALPGAPGADGPRVPIQQLQAGLAAAPDEAGLTRLVAACFDLRRTAHQILAGLPQVDARAESRLADALGLRLRRELRRHPPLPPTMTWIEDRSLGPDEWLVLTRVPNPDGDAQVLAWRVSTGEPGPRIIDLLRDGVSGLRARRAEFASLVPEIGLEAALAAEEQAARAVAAKP